MKPLKGILMIFGIIIAAALLYLLLIPDTDRAGKKEELSDISRQYEEYTRQIRELKSQIARKEQELQGEETGWVILAFSAEDPDLMSMIYDTVNEAGLQATVVLDPQKLPRREETALTLQDMQRLQEAGWDFAFGGAWKEQVSYQDLFSEANTYMEQQGMGITQAFFFNGGDYQKGKDEILKAMDAKGFSLGAAFGSAQTERLSSMRLEDYPSVSLCQNVSMREGLETAKRMISLSHSEKKPLVLSDYTTCETWETGGESSIEELGRIITVVKDMQSAQRIAAGNVTSFLEYDANRNREDSEKQQEYEAFKKECEDEIAELEMERRNLGVE